MFDRRSILFLAPLLAFSSASLVQGAQTFNPFKNFAVGGATSYQWNYFVTTRARSSFDPPDRRAASDTVSFLPGSPPTAPEMHAQSGSSDAFALSVVGSAGSSSAGHGVHGLAARGTDDYARSYAESTLGWIPQSGTSLEFSPQGHIWAKAVDQEGSSYDQMGDPVVATWNLPAGPKVLNIFEVTGSANTGEARWSGPGIEFTDVINGHFEITIPSDGFLVSPGLGGSLRVQFTAEEAPVCTTSGELFQAVACPFSGTDFLDLSPLMNADGSIDFQFSQPVDRVDSKIDSISIRWGDDTSQGFDLTPPSAAPQLLGGTQYAELVPPPPIQAPPTLQRVQGPDPYDGYLNLADNAPQSNVIFLDKSRDVSNSTVLAQFRFRMTDSDNLAQGDAGLGFILMPTAEFGDQGVPTILPEAWLDTGTASVNDTSFGLGFDIIADNGDPLNRISMRHAEDSNDENLSVVNLSDGQWHEAQIQISETNNEVMVTVYELATISNGAVQEEIIQASETVVFPLNNYPIALAGFRSALGARTTGAVDVDEVMVRYGDSVDNDDAIQSLCGRLQEGSPIPDLNGDGVGNLLDLERLVLPGDADRDDAVDMPDFALLLENFTLPGNWDVGDFDCDGVVQFSDFVILSDHWGLTAAVAAGVAEVPEPAGGALAILAACGLVVSSRRRSGGC